MYPGLETAGPPSLAWIQAALLVLEVRSGPSVPIVAQQIVALPRLAHLGGWIVAAPWRSLAFCR